MRCGAKKCKFRVIAVFGRGGRASRFSNGARRSREEHYGAVLVLPPLDGLVEPGDVLLEPMLPLEEPMLLLEPMSLDGLADELGLVAELSEPLIGPEGEVAPVPLSVP